MNLIEEVARRTVERDNEERGEDWTSMASARNWVGPIVADVLDILTADGRVTADGWTRADVPTCALCGGQRWLIEPGKPLTCMTRGCGTFTAAQTDAAAPVAAATTRGASDE